MTTFKKTIGLFEQESGIYDIEIDESGDFRNDDSYDTEINISLKSDRRADSSEVVEPKLRRGWEGDLVTPLNGYLIGSKWWLLKQSRWNQDTVNNYVSDTENALQHFTDRELADRIQVTGQLINFEKIQIDVTFYIENNVVAKYTTNIWKGSKYVA